MKGELERPLSPGALD